MAIDTDKNTFLMTILIKLTLGNIFIKVKKIRQDGATVTIQLIYSSNADNSTSLTLPGSPGVSIEAKLSTKFEFGSFGALKLGQKLRNFKKPPFFEHSSF